MLYFFQIENVDGVQPFQEFDPGNLTFAPEFSSTRNFSKEAALLASTPMFAAPLPIPPVSAIKPVGPQSMLPGGDVTGEPIDSTIDEMKRRKSMLPNYQNLR